MHHLAIRFGHTLFCNYIGLVDFLKHPENFPLKIFYKGDSPPLSGKFPLKIFPGGGGGSPHPKNLTRHLCPA